MLIRTMISVLVLGLVLAAPSARAARTFCCDDHGTRVCGDVLPAACSSKGYSEFNERGTRGPNHEAPLTEAQQAARDAEMKKKNAAEKLALDQQRRDQALLSTYANEGDLDNARDRALAEVDRSTKQIQDKLEQFLKEQKKLKTDVAASAGQEMPQDLKEQISRNNLNIKTQQDAIVSKKQELEQIKAKFEADRQRLRELHGEKKDVAAAPEAKSAR